MLRGGPRTAVQNIRTHQQLLQEQEELQSQQKQKKRLSFRDPEVEGPQRNHNSFGGCKSKTLARPTSARPKIPISKRQSSSVEDLTLEDQAMHIAQHVGNAFSELSLSDGERYSFSGSLNKETDIIDSSPPQDIPNYSTRFKIYPGDGEYYESSEPALTDKRAMRGPHVDNEDATVNENCIPVELEARSSSSELHQIQMLRYQLDQQNQQTQMALHQIQLLQDQMSAESAARRKAQEQNNELMQQNTELLNHMEKLFSQIEELERQVQLSEQERRGRRSVSSHHSPVASMRQPISYTAHRRQSTELTLQNRLKDAAAKSPEQDRTAVSPRSSYIAARKSSLTLTKPLATVSKSLTAQNSTHYNPISNVRKNTAMSQKTYGAQNKISNTPKDTLRIGDTSPSIQGGKASPFNSAWKVKPTDSSPQATTVKNQLTGRSQTGSFSSIGKKPQEPPPVKSTLFSSASSLTAPGIKGKKYSSSTSDLYASQSTTQSKSSLLIEEPPSPKVRTAVSNLSINSTSTASKLPRYQPYTGWQRRTSLTNDNEAGTVKESQKNISTLFNR